MTAARKRPRSYSDPLPVPTTKRVRGNILQRFPDDVKLCIRDFLSYQDAIRLSQVNRYFHRHVDPQKWPAADKTRFAYEAEVWLKHDQLTELDGNAQSFYVRYTNAYACLQCCRVLPIEKFASSQIRRQNAKHAKRFEHHGYRRSCIDCAVKNHLYGPGIVLETFWSKTWKIEVQRNHQRYVDPLENAELFLCQHCGWISTFDRLQWAKIHAAARGEEQSSYARCTNHDPNDIHHPELGPSEVAMRGYMVIRCHQCKSEQELLDPYLEPCCQKKAKEHRKAAKRKEKEARDKEKRARGRPELPDIFEEDECDLLQSLSLVEN